MKIGEAHYKALGEKNLEKIGQCLYVEMIEPLSKVSGKSDLINNVMLFFDAKAFYAK